MHFNCVTIWTCGKALDRIHGQQQAGLGAFGQTVLPIQVAVAFDVGVQAVILRHDRSVIRVLPHIHVRDVMRRALRAGQILHLQTPAIEAERRVEPDDTVDPHIGYRVRERKGGGQCTIAEDRVREGAIEVKCAAQHRGKAAEFGSLQRPVESAVDAHRPNGTHDEAAAGASFRLLANRLLRILLRSVRAKQRLRLVAHRGSS